MSILKSLFKYFHLKKLNRLSTLILSEEKQIQNESLLEPNENMQVISIQPEKTKFPLRSYNLAPYINHSENLQILVKLGVDISIFELNNQVANAVIKMEKPKLMDRVWFLQKQFDLTDQLGKMLTKCPELLTEIEQNIIIRKLYLQSKLFSNDRISLMVSKTPKLLITPIKILDESIGFVQKLFGLTGEETRHVVGILPKIIFNQRFNLQENLLSLDRFLGFNKEEIKFMLMTDPRILIAGNNALKERFNYLHNTIGLSHEQILLWPTILRTRVSTIKPRHEFLVSIHMDQYDKTLENFVPLQSLAIGDDVKFCSEVAKVQIQLYNDFLKTL